MGTIELHELAGDDRLLHLNVTIPVSQANQRYQVLLAVRPEGVEPPREWPAGFRERLAGSWVGEFPDESEGSYEERSPL